MLLNKDHYLNLKDGAFDETTKDDLDHLFTTLEKDPTHDNLVVHFHGGLVNKQSGLDAAEHLMEYFQNLDAYQVFFIWESGLFDVLSQELGAISKDPTFQQLSSFITQFAAPFKAQFTAIPPRNTPLQEAEKDQFRQALTDGNILQAVVQAVAQGPNIEEVTGVVERVMDRFAQGRGHGLYATIVEELLRQFYLGRVGKDIWNQMKQETLDAFRPDPTQYGGTAFLQGLKSYWERGQRPRITLVGHSAGAIYICRFLQYANWYQLPNEIKFDLVFLAPACTFKLFSETLKNYEQCIAGIRVFGMRDELEQGDPLVPSVPLVYPYSLLYFISGILEDEPDTPLVGMQRYYTGKAPYTMPEVMKSLDYLSAPGTERTVWSVVNAGDGLASSATTHGGFHDDVPTRESLRYIILNRLP